MYWTSEEISSLRQFLTIALLDPLISIRVSGPKTSSQKTTGDIVKFSKHIAILGMLASFTCVAQTIKSDGSPDVSPPKLERMPESLEVRYALSAAPRICALARQHMCWIRPRDIS